MVATFNRSATIAPSASSTEAFSPVPPMSTANVSGWRGSDLTVSVGVGSGDPPSLGDWRSLISTRYVALEG